MEHNVKEFESARNDRKAAEGWWKLRTKRDHLGGPFETSPSHGAIKLTFCGQDAPSAKNYHESPAGLNRELMKVIDRRLPELVEEAIGNLRAIERKKFDAIKDEFTGWLAEMDEGA